MNRIVSQNDLFDVLRGSEWHGRYFLAYCPCHDDRRKKSLLVYGDAGVCLASCGRLSFSKLWKAAKGVRRGEAGGSDTQQKFSSFIWPREFSQLEDLALSAHSTLLSFSQHFDYFEKRGVGECVERNLLGWTSGFYSIPFFDGNDNFLGMTLRAGEVLEKKTKATYLIPTGQAPLLFCPDWARVERSKFVYVVFGLFDALTLSAMNLPVVTSSDGQVFRSEWLDTIRKRIVFVPDRGEEQGSRELAAKTGWRGKVGLLKYPDGIKDANGFVEKGHRKSLEVQLASFV